MTALPASPRAPQEVKKRFNATVIPVDASTPELRLAALLKADVALCAGRAGLQILSAEDLKKAPNLLVAADVNAVPPYGIEGLELMDNGKELAGGALGVGPLAIGDIKYKTKSAALPENGGIRQSSVP